jgi:heavy metal sensor kinase
LKKTKAHFSISLRLTFWFSVVFLAGFAVFGAIMWANLAQALSQGRDKTVSTRASRLADLLKNSQKEDPLRRRALFADFAEATPEGRFIQVFETGGARLYPPPYAGAIAFPWPKVPFHGTRQFSQVWFQGRLYRVFSQPLLLHETTLRIFVAGQLEDNRQLLHRFEVGLFSATPAFILAAALCGYFLGRRALDPVARLTDSVRSISVGRLSGRLPISPTGDQLQRLAETCNDMLGRLESAVAQITKFTADASHELRSPVAFIRTVAEYALRNPHIDAASAESFRDIVRETEDASRLLDDMLTLARSDAGHFETVFETVDLAEIVEDSCARIQPAASAKQQALSVQTESAVPLRVTGDGPSLRRLFWILLDNAVKYTPLRGEIRVSLTGNAAEARVCVSDNGMGIPDSALPHIFDRFYRVDTARTQEEGTGLGLAIAKWIADVHHAALSVESRLNSGSTFQVVIRRVA